MPRAVRSSDSASRRMARSPNPREGSTLEGFLQEQGLFEETSARAIKAVLAWQISMAMKHRKISKAEMARQMGTGRSALARLLDPTNEAVTLITLFRAASVLGAELRVALLSPGEAAPGSVRVSTRSPRQR